MAPHTTPAPSSPADSPPPRAPRVLVVFDFDESLVDDDSEIYFGKALCPQLLIDLATTLYARGGVNSYVAETALGIFHERIPHVTREQMRDAIARVPASPQMLDAVKLAVDMYGAAPVIVSDSNEFYISNKAQWEDDESTCLRVWPYHPEKQEPHGCALCPSNLCKGRILDELRKKTEYDIVLYVGDGRDDYCPVTRLTSHDTVFARANDASGRSFGLLQMIKDAPHSMQAHVVEWQTGGDIFEHFQKTLEAAAIE